MTAAQDAMDTMTAQYYNALITGAGLDPSQFQLAQGAIVPTADSSSIWRFFDSMPPDSVNNYFQTSQLNSFSQTYGAVVNNLIPQTDNQAQKLLADQYVNWQKYEQANPLDVKDWTDEDEIEKAKIARFNKWAYNAGIDQSTINSMQTLMSQVDIVSVAMGMYNSAKKSGTFAYTASVTDMNNALTGGQPKSFSLDSKTQSSTLNGKWAQAQMSAHYWFVSVSASSKFANVVTDMAAKGIKMDISFSKLATLPGGPYSLTTKMSPDLSNYVSWYNSETFQTARKQNDNLLWKHSAPTWDQTFGPNGNMQQATTALVFVDGVTTTLTTTASVAKSDQTDFSAAAAVGVWPWFQGSGAGGWENKTKFNDDGSFTITSGAPLGNPVLLGALVTDIANAFT